ncbi:hypothetical protein KP77_09280 [Jeotgalibacillus alimentarius]|uniref:Uncharacterized protein n=1 Tax=Jeotgalibacillus alimentarius TaxID=135826 RepID=A0A0C2W483_9BACL|nr:effector binding domain-containing protein [Jeotgalibacillus alimentarius]KIL51416.1 hypothetical protein KP77_09280 [Jeotgalibacillus alimentarius]
MEAKVENKTFKLIGLKGKSKFKNFSLEVPSLASVLLRKIDDTPYHKGTEAGVFEPCAGDVEAEGVFYVGVLTDELPREIPEELTVIKISEKYAVTEGNINHISELHQKLNDWIRAEGHTRKEEDFIVETYHPQPEGENVKVYLPLKRNS